MRSINKVFLMGNLGADIELRYSEAGKPIGKMRLATRHARKQEDGSWEELTNWHRVVLFGPLAERCHKHLSKGSGVLVEGRLSERNYEDADNVKRHITEVIAWEVVFLPRANRAGAPADQVQATDADVPF